MIRIACVALLAVPLLAVGCAPAEDWSDPEYIQYRMELNDPRAFDEYAHLTDEQKAQLVPTLVEVFESGLRQQECLRSLVAAADPRGKDVFLTALGRTDDGLAALAARGLAAIDATDASMAVAERLASVTQHEAYAGFLEALNAIPTDQAADVVAGVLMRPAARIGGVNSVRRGCNMLAKVSSPSNEVIDALVFGLVNLNPQPFEDAMNECELALIAHGEQAVPKLAEMFAGNNQAVNTHLNSLHYQLTVAKLRAGAVLAHIGNPAATNVLIQWFSTQQEIPVSELERMTPEQASAWYDFHGQLFTAAVGGLAYAGSEASLDTLRRLESTEGETSLLKNFQVWFQLSAGAEFGLRTVVQEGLMKAGSDQDRELLWTRAESGTVPTARGEYFQAELRKNALHYVGRVARRGEMERYTALANAQSNPGDFLMHLGYFALAEECGDDVACYTGRLADPAPILQQEAVTTALAGVTDEATAEVIRSGILQNVRTGAVWQLGKRLGGQTSAADALLGALDNPSMQVRFEAVEAMFFAPNLPAGAAERFEAFLEEQADSTAQGARELRHQVRLLRSRRL